MREIEAAVINAAGQRTTIETLRLDDPRPGRGPGPDDQRRASATRDLHVRDGDWERPGPIVMGHEGAGVIEAVGAGHRSSRRRAGRRPSAGTPPASAAASASAGASGCAPARRPCATPRPTAPRASPGPDGSPVLAYLLHRDDGAPHQVVPASAVVPMPDGVPPEVAALIGCGVSTGVGAVLKTAAVPAGATVAVIGLGGVGLSCVMGAVLAGRAADRRRRHRAGPRSTSRASSAPPTGSRATRRTRRRTVEGIRRPRPATAARTSCSRPSGCPVTDRAGDRRAATGRDGGPVGLHEVRARPAAFEPFPFVDGGRRILGSNYGSAVAAVDFPRYAEAYLAGRLPIDRLIDRRLPLADLEDAFDRLRAGEAARQMVMFERLSGRATGRGAERPERRRARARTTAPGAPSGTPAARRRRPRARRGPPARSQVQHVRVDRGPRTPSRRSRRARTSGSVTSTARPRSRTSCGTAGSWWAWSAIPAVGAEIDAPSRIRRGRPSRGAASRPRR